MRIAFLFLGPFLAALSFLFLPPGSRRTIRFISLGACLFSLFNFVGLLASFNPNSGLQAIAVIPWLETWGFQLSLGYDGISLPFLALTAILSVVGVFYSSDIEKNLREYHILYLLLVGGAYGLFLAQNLFFIFFFLELEVLTAYFLISIWGRPHSEKNAFQFILFAALSGILFLAFVGIVYFKTGAKSLELDYLKDYFPNSNDSFRAVSLLLLSSLTILSALFPFHAWGPLGYQAASRGVNTLLVGVIKKAGPYLFIRLALELFPTELRQFSGILITLCFVNILYVGWIAMAERDPKLMAGYSSSSHMGYILLGILSFSTIGLTGALILSFAHGLSAALLFATVGRVENQVGPFRFQQVAGIGKKAPFLHFIFTSAALASAGLPGFANFVGEILIFFALVKMGNIPLFLAIFGALLSVVYLLRAVKNIFHGTLVSEHEIQDEKPFSKLATIFVMASLLILGILPLPFIHWISPQVSKIIQAIP